MQHVRIVVGIVFAIVLFPFVALAWCVDEGIQQLERIFGNSAKG